MWLATENWLVPQIKGNTSVEGAKEKGEEVVIRAYEGRGNRAVLVAAQLGASGFVLLSIYLLFLSSNHEEW
jgi:hypothetical protein